MTEFPPPLALALSKFLLVTVFDNIIKSEKQKKKKNGKKINNRETGDEIPF